MFLGSESLTNKQIEHYSTQITTCCTFFGSEGLTKKPTNKYCMFLGSEVLTNKQTNKQNIVRFLEVNC